MTQNNKVYALMEHWDWDSGDLLGVFSTEEKAIKYIEDLLQDRGIICEKNPDMLLWRKSGLTLEITEQLLDEEYV